MSDPTEELREQVTELLGEPNEAVVDALLVFATNEVARVAGGEMVARWQAEDGLAKAQRQAQGYRGMKDVYLRERNAAHTDLIEAEKIIERLCDDREAGQRDVRQHLAKIAHLAEFSPETKVGELLPLVKRLIAILGSVPPETTTERLDQAVQGRDRAQLRVRATQDALTRVEALADGYEAQVREVEAANDGPIPWTDTMVNVVAHIRKAIAGPTPPKGYIRTSSAPDSKPSVAPGGTGGAEDA